MLTRKILFGLVVAFLACSTTLVAQDVEKAGKKKKDPTKRTTAALMRSFKKANLNDEQQASAKAIVEKHLESYLEARKATTELLTKEKIALQKEAIKKGKADGLKGKELAAAGLAATGLTEAELAGYAEAKKKVASISKTVQTEILALLTDEQKAAMPAKGKKAKGGDDAKMKKEKKAKKGKKKDKKKDDAEESTLSAQAVSLTLPNMT